ncbi:MAG: sugar ABC transporter permease [Clostridiaceae bacterium]|nr:sugar ABC transporter permease [Clostridiaceae bacterium]
MAKKEINGEGGAIQVPTRGLRFRFKRYLPIYLLMIPVMLWFIIFQIAPIYGLQLAFKDYNVMKGVWDSPWNNFAHFKQLFSNYYFSRVLVNTIKISFLRLITSVPMAVIFALLLNEVRNVAFKRVAQTISYLPYFISWVVAGGIFNLMLSPQYGAINAIISFFGGEPIYFLGDPKHFVGTVIVTGIWKTLGWDSIIYIAALSSIDQELYEAAHIDGANRFQRMIYISLPSLMPTIVMLLTLGLAGILSGGFDQIYNMYNPRVYSVGDIIDTYVYRQGFEMGDYAFNTAVGLFKSVVSFILIMSANAFSRRVVKYSMW